MTTPAYSRVLLKISGESLVGEHDYGIDPEVSNQLADEIATVQKEGIEIAIVIGGGVSNLPMLYNEGRERIAELVLNRELSTQIRPNQLGDASGVYGAAALA